LPASSLFRACSNCTCCDKYPRLSLSR
jgi:hypothetical protein